MNKKDKEILNLLSEGFSIKEIAVITGDKTHRTKYLIEKMRKQYKAKNNTQLVSVTLNKVI